MKSYLKFLSRNKLYTAVMAVGLVVSLSFVIIIGSYTAQQYRVTRENPDRKDIYSFGMPDYLGLTYGFTEAVADKVPEVELAVRYSCGREGYVTLGEENIEVKVSAIESDFFKMFPYYRFVEGGPEVLDAVSNVVVSKSFARQHGIAVGQGLKLSGEDYIVAGILEDFKGTLLTYSDIFVNQRNPLNSYSFETPFDHYGSVIPFVKFAPGTDRQTIYDKVEAVCKEVYPDMYGRAFFERLDVARFDELFFKEYNHNAKQLNHGDRGTLRLLLLVGLLLLLSAVFNYVNLGIALTGKRAKEMAVRRLVGALKSDVILKYVIESVAFTAVCFAADRSKGIAIRKVFGGTVDSELWRNVREYMIMVALACVIGIPVAVWAAGKYLENYIYRLENYGWAFVLAVVITLAAAFASVLWQTLSAARTNPATELKKE